MRGRYGVQDLAYGPNCLIGNHGSLGSVRGVERSECEDSALGARWLRTQRGVGELSGAGKSLILVFVCIYPDCIVFPTLIIHESTPHHLNLSFLTLCNASSLSLQGFWVPLWSYQSWNVSFRR